MFLVQALVALACFSAPLQAAETGENWSRTYDKQGGLKELVRTDSTKSPVVREKIEISHSPETLTHSVFRGDALVSRDIERYSKPGRLSERESTWSSTGGAQQDRKLLTRYRDGGARRTEYALREGAWVVVSEKSASAFHHEELVAEDDAARTREYVSCLMASGRVKDETGCSRLLDRLPLAVGQLGVLANGTVGSLACTSDQQLFLPNGFSMDLSTCSEKEAQEAIGRVTDGMIGGQVACLDRINHRLASRFLESLVARRPQIKCAGSRSRVSDDEFCEHPDDRNSDCMRDLLRARKDTDAFVNGMYPNNIYLTQGDPMNGPNPEKERGLGATIFHEMLHATGHFHHGGEDAFAGPLHDASPPGFDDVVYGCEALCGPNPIELTREGCEACVTAEGNLPTKASRKADPNFRKCADYPSAAAVRRLATAVWIAAKSARCERATDSAKADSCAALASTEDRQAICGKMAVSDKDCISAMRESAARSIVKTALDPKDKSAFSSLANPSFASRMVGVLEGVFCERRRHGYDLDALREELGGGRFPGAPATVELKNSEGKIVSVPYALTAEGCESWDKLRSQGYVP